MAKVRHSPLREKNDIRVVDVSKENRVDGAPLGKRNEDNTKEGHEESNSDNNQKKK